MALIKFLVVFLVCTELVSATTIECEFADVNWSGFDNYYSCVGTIVITASGRNVLEIIGEHTNGRTNANVTGLSIYNQLSLNQLPDNIAEFLPNLSAFDWVFGNLTSVTSGDLNSIGNLTVLSLYGNRLTNLDGDLFRDQPNIQFIDFGDNLIENVGEQLLDSLPELRWAFFQRNPCVDTIAATPQAIQELSAQLANECTAVAALSISCSFSDVNWSGFNDFYTCTGIVGVTGNVRTIGATSGNHVDDRSNLDVTGLSIYNEFVLNQLPENFAQFFPNLLALDWVFGNLTTISAADLNSLRNLTVLNLYGNQLAVLEPNLFSNTLNLQFIDFGENLFGKIGTGLLETLPELRWAFFQRNPCVNAIAATPQAIQELSTQLANQCTAVAALSISCSFSDVNWSGFNDFYTCTGIVGVTGNARTIGATSGNHVDDRSNLDVTGLSIYNEFVLNQLPENFAQFFPNLLALDWVFGNLTTISAEDLNSLRNLTVLNLYGNRLAVLEANLFSNTLNLQFIDFGENLLGDVADGLIESLPELRWAFFQRNPCVDTIAATPQAIQELSTQLANQCPATDSVVCPLACVSRISSLEARVQQLENALNTLMSSKF